ncbi:2-hydroxychromene-2-carboxylate isomerase [Rhizobacter sp. Root404]|uniref:2-hydroxychromene-2-carboxylate isomerase n=1 Tax=Rhizobacter sp. Root404 TaxID=1736528 RepID=UPI0006F8C420|nr:2-hydroxychromene-2-carboxylate isomerase [Rhizobacter sp. Root404]KQW35458.1 disulfide bond formation protein DsbA [Rhizobacter sp. Root404]
MSKQVEFFFDVGSPTTYLAWTQLPGLCAQAGAELVYRPMLLGGVFQATGNASPANVPAKARYMDADMARYARRYGVPLASNLFFPINTLVLMRGATGVQLRAPARFDAYLRGVFHAMWVEPQNLNDPATAAKALAAAGFDPAEVMGWANDAEVKAALRATTEEAVARGVFGAPTMFVGTEMFFGQDRLDAVREALA